MFDNKFLQKKRLFVLGLAQIAGQVSIPSILSLIVSHQQSRLARDNQPINVKEVTACICKIHEYVQTLVKLGIDEKEFAYLRAIALFGAGEQSRVVVSFLDIGWRRKRHIIHGSGHGRDHGSI